MMDTTLNAMFTPRAVAASKRLMTEVPASGDATLVLNELQPSGRMGIDSSSPSLAGRSRGSINAITVTCANIG
jgi:hypothetical protein